MRPPPSSASALALALSLLAGCAVAREDERPSVYVYGDGWSLPTGRASRQLFVEKRWLSEKECHDDWITSSGPTCTTPSRRAALRPERITCSEAGGASCAIEPAPDGTVRLVLDRVEPGPLVGTVIVVDDEKGTTHELPFAVSFVPSRLRVERCPDDRACEADIGDRFETLRGNEIVLGASVARVGAVDAAESDPTYPAEAMLLDASGATVRDLGVRSRAIPKRYLGPDLPLESSAHRWAVRFETPGTRALTVRFGRLERTIDVDVE